MERGKGKRGKKEPLLQVLQKLNSKLRAFPFQQDPPNPNCGLLL